jgi:hypothetical protein
MSERENERLVHNRSKSAFGLNFERRPEHAAAGSEPGQSPASRRFDPTPHG